MYDSIFDTVNKLSVADFMACEGNDVRILWLSAFCYDTKDSLNFRPHNHTFYEVHFLTEGSLCYRFEDTEVNIPAGSFVLIPPHSIHCIVDHSSDFKKITISFEVKDNTDVSESLSDIIKRVCPTGDDIMDTLSFISRRIDQKSPYLNQIINNRLIETVYLLAASSDRRPPSPITFYDPRLLKAKKFIEDNPHIFLSCDEVAQCCRLSPKQLGRLFQQYENCSLLAFIHGQKVEAAKKMIRETDELFELISEQLGFSSVNYFGKFFTRCTGMTPGEYRRTHSSSAKPE